MSYGHTGSPYWRPPQTNQDVYRQPLANYISPQPCVAPYYRMPMTPTVDPYTYLSELRRDVEGLRRVLESEVQTRQRQEREYREKIERLEKEVAELRARQTNNANVTPTEANSDPLYPIPVQQPDEDPESSLRDFLAGFYDNSLQTNGTEGEDAADAEVRAINGGAMDGGDLYLFGGMCSGNTINRTVILPDHTDSALSKGTVGEQVERFDGDGGGYWIPVGDLPAELDGLHLSAVAYNRGIAFLFSGFPQSAKELSVFKCTLSAEETRWMQVTSPKAARCLAGHACLGNRICIAGGYTSNRPYVLDVRTGLQAVRRILWSRSVFPFPPDLTRMEALDVVEIYDPNRNSWTYLPSLSQKRIRTVLIPESEHSLYAVGGLTFGASGLLRPTNTIERYDGRQGRWVPLAHMQHGRAFFDVVQVDQHQFVALGGISSSVSTSLMLETGATDSVECYESRMNKWILLPSMPSNRCMFTAQRFLQDCVYIIGGQPVLSRGQRMTPGSGMVIYNWRTLTWGDEEMLAGMSSKRYAHASCVV